MRVSCRGMCYTTAFLLAAVRGVYPCSAVANDQHLGRLGKISTPLAKDAMHYSGEHRIHESILRPDQLGKIPCCTQVVRVIPLNLYLTDHGQ